MKKIMVILLSFIVAVLFGFSAYYEDCTMKESGKKMGYDSLPL